jgi:hypothetical protein
MNFTSGAAQYFKDIRFWIILFFIVRLYGITFPPLEVGHNWRQTDGLMIARNFYERDPNIFYPTVDLGGEKTGIVGCEFPLLNYSVYLVSLVFGYEHWYGRIIVLIFSSIGVFFFHRLIRKYFGESAAFNAAILLMVSFWFSYSRKNIPDVFAISICFIALHFAFEYFEKGKWRNLLLYFVLGLLGCLAKISAATILTVLLIPVLNKENLLSRKVALISFSIIILIAIYAWYFVWVPYLNEIYGLAGHFFMGTSFVDGWKQVVAHIDVISKRFYDTPMKYTGFAAFAAGLFLVIRKKHWIVLATFLLPFIGYLLIIIKTGSSIIGDTYYVITVVPCMAFIAGYGLSLIENKKIVTAVLIIVSIEGIAARMYDFRIRQPYKALADLEVIMDGVSNRNDLIAVNGPFDNPTGMYFAHRRGWSLTNEFLADTNNLAEIKNKGCKYIVIVRKLYGDMNLALPKVHESEYFKIYALTDR